MRLFVAFILGFSIAFNINTMVSELFVSDSRMPSFPYAVHNTVESDAYTNEVIQTMKTNRILNSMAFLMALGLLPAASNAQAAGEADITAVVNSVVIDNIKTVAGSGAQSLAVMNTALANTQTLAMQNAVSNQQAMNQLQTKMVAQTTITSATEGSKAIETVQQSGDAANTAQALALLSAFLNSNVNQGVQ